MKPKSIKPKPVYFRISINGIPGKRLHVDVYDLDYAVKKSFACKTVSQSLSWCELAINSRLEARIAK